MWPVIEAVLAGVGAFTVAFVALYWLLCIRGQPPLADETPENVEWARRYTLLWERYKTQAAEIERLRCGRDDAEGDDA